MQNREPTFVGIGVQKSGTTSLSNMLRDMGAQIPVKELHFSWRQGGRGDYLDRFDGVDNQKVFGEFTPNYIWDSHTLFSLARNLNGTKFLIALRNPVDRFYSACQHGIGRGEIPIDVEPRELLDDVLAGKYKKGWAASLVWNGLLGPHVSRAFQLLGEERVMAVFLEELRDPLLGPGVIQEVAKFVGLDGRGATFPHVNRRSFWAKRSGAVATPDPAVDARLAEFYQPSNSLLAETLGRRLPWE